MNSIEDTYVSRFCFRLPITLCLRVIVSIFNKDSDGRRNGRKTPRKLHRRVRPVLQRTTIGTTFLHRQNGEIFCVCLSVCLSVSLSERKRLMFMSQRKLQSEL